MSVTRLATRRDIPRLAELLGELFSQEREFAPDPTAQTRGLALLFDREDSVRIIVTEALGDVVGMGVLHYSVSTYLGAKVAMLEDVVVTNSQRGNGTGKRLMAAIIAQARSDGAQRLTLLTDNDNLPARQFYESFGFARSTMLPYRLLLPTTLTV
jgi:N-acetylglutamate synthase-like GNAT family acetyltransferase